MAQSIIYPQFTLISDYPILKNLAYRVVLKVSRQGSITLDQGSTGIAFSAGTGTGTGIGKKCRDRDFAGTGTGTENFFKCPKFS